MQKILVTVMASALLVLFETCVHAVPGNDCNNGGRYEINGYGGTNGTVTDCRTGLVWLQNAKCTDTSNTIANPNGYLIWSDAMKWVAGLGNGICGLSDGSVAGDWRLPTRSEWMAMVQSANNQNISNPSLTNVTGTGQWTEGNVFNNVQSVNYWSSATFANEASQAWIVYMWDGTMYNRYKSDLFQYVWPVRGGQSGSFGSLRIE